ncbi:MAG: phosphate acyltransferase PlsX [Bacteroidales bacterium]|nr:phosphate acyltransferase PlsX [Bacteroidales bacterium]
MRIGVDAMGGDYAPENVILGVIDAYSHLDSETKIFLVGDQEKITEVCRHYGLDSGNFVVIHASQTIGMGEHPVKSYLQKCDSSINVGFNKLLEGEIDAFASAGSTGAMLMGCVRTLKTLKGLLRPCISAQIPLANGKNMLILDVGLNTESKPKMLYQFGIIGSIYAKTMMGIANPRVALLNIGEEREKGTLVAQEAYKMMEASEDLNFVGNMEANSLFNGGIADVLVTDGFVGNVCLKQTESMYEMFSKLGVNHPFLSRFNYEYYGGTPVLGVTAPVVIGHGASTPLAIRNMILEAEKSVKNRLVERVQDAMSGQ